MVLCCSFSVLLGFFPSASSSTVCSLLTNVVVLCVCFFCFFAIYSTISLLRFCRRRWASDHRVSAEHEDWRRFHNNKQTDSQCVWWRERASERASEQVSEWVISWAFNSLRKISYFSALEANGVVLQTLVKIKTELKQHQFSAFIASFVLLFLLLSSVCVWMIRERSKPKISIWNGFATPFCDHWRSLVYGFVCEPID